MNPLIFLFFFLPLSIFTLPSNDWLDSTELSLSAISIGIGHPPGQIPFTILGHLFTYLPLGNLAYRTSLLSVVTLALAFTFLYELSREKKSSWILLFWLISILLDSHVLQLGIRTEVYALSSVLFAFN